MARRDPNWAARQAIVARHARMSGGRFITCGFAEKIVFPSVEAARSAAEELAELHREEPLRAYVCPLSGSRGHAHLTSRPYQPPPASKQVGKGRP